MFKKLTYYALCAAVFTAFLTDKTLFGEVGNIAPLFLTLALISLLSGLSTQRELKNQLKGFWNDRWVRLVVIGGLSILVWQIVSNSFAGWTTYAIKQQLFWLVGVFSALTFIAAAKTGFLRGLRTDGLWVVFGLAQAVNLAVGFAQIPQLVSTASNHTVYLHGTVWYPQFFGALCAISAGVFWRLALSPGRGTATRRALLSLMFFSVVLIPLTGTRTSTLCLLSTVVVIVLLFPKNIRHFWIVPAAFIVGLLFMGNLSDSRAMQIQNSSTIGRKLLYLNDLNIARDHFLFGIGMDIERYRNETRKGPYFKKFMEVDPWVAASPIPHSGILAIVVQQGVPSILFYVLFIFGIVGWMYRSALCRTGGSEEIRIWLAAYLVFNMGLLVHPLSYSFQWILLSVGLARASFEGDAGSATRAMPMGKVFFFEILSAKLDSWWWLKKRFLPPMAVTPPTVKRIVVLGFLGIGDWMVALPVLSALKTKYPGVDIIVLTDHLGEEILDLAGTGVRVTRIPLSKKGLGKFVEISRWTSQHRVELRADLIIGLWWNQTHEFLACRLDYDHYLGFFSCRGDLITRLANRFYPLESNLFRSAAVAREEQWFGDAQKSLCEALGVSWVPVQWEPPRYELPAGFADGHRVVVCQLHSFIGNNNWPESSWIVALNLLLQRHFDLVLVLVGSNSEAGTASFVKAALPRDRVLNLCGKTTLKSLAGLLRRADLFIGTDSGPGHLASSVGAKSLLLYGPTRPGNYLPAGFCGKTLWAGVACSPCGLRTCFLNEKPGCDCMTALSPRAVVAAVEELLS